MHEMGNGIFKSDIDDNIYIIGDIHGDYQCLIHCLVDLCKVCNISKIYNDIEFNTSNREYLEWNKNNTSTVIFCGDMIHRKRYDKILDDECSDIYILETLMRLKNEAIKNNGNIILISGNHEIMNIVIPSNHTYVSPNNVKTNDLYFTNNNFVNKYIENSYAWIKLNNILLTHAGLCSEYLDETQYTENIVEEINDKYHISFKNLKDLKNTNSLSYSLFIKYDEKNNKTHNMFWCREWGYGKINCDQLQKILKKVKCDKMIIAHCPQFATPEKPQMINFECKINSNNLNEEYILARIDLGMSRCFDYNSDKFFLNHLSNNYNRKISVLKLQNDHNNLYFNCKGIITQKISCMQYLLLKYGFMKQNWDKKNIYSNWLGFNYINNIKNINKCNNDVQNGICCLISPILNCKNKYCSIEEYKKCCKILNF
jgi:hypothetical protein